MPLRIKLKINVTKLLKEYFFHGKNGVYVDLVGFDKPDQYGNDGFLQQDLPRDVREAGKVRAEICGSFKIMGPKPSGAPVVPVAPPPADDVKW
jgi:hypothetical protein